MVPAESHMEVCCVALLLSLSKAMFTAVMQDFLLCWQEEHVCVCLLGDTLPQMKAVSHRGVNGGVSYYLLSHLGIFINHKSAKSQQNENKTNKNKWEMTCKVLSPYHIT